MAAAKTGKARVARRHWPLTEKRRIVELTLSVGTSVMEIARTHALHPNIVHQWRRLYRAGKLDAQSAPALQSDKDAVSAMLVPVRVVPAVRQSRSVVQRDTSARCSSVMHVMLASGSALRIESAAIDAALVCAVVAELRR
jgi:transposase-like protein